MDKKEIKDFIRKVWITRKSRIEASERIKNKYIIYDSIRVYYSIIIVGLSIWNIQASSSNDNISVFILIASISLTIFSVHIKSQNYQKRYFNLKNVYIELDNIKDRAKKLKKEQNEEKFRELRERYRELLKIVENHSTFDYLKVMRSASEEELSYFEQFKLICYYCKYFSKMIFLILIPVLIFFYYIF